MTDVDYSALAARVLKRKSPTVRESGLSRDRGIAIIAQAMRESRRAKRRLCWWVSGAVTTAVAAAAVLTLPRYLQHSHDASGAHHVAPAAHRSDAAPSLQQGRPTGAAAPHRAPRGSATRLVGALLASPVVGSVTPNACRRSWKKS